MLFAVLAIVSYVLQNTYCKEYGRKFPDTLYAQAAMTVFSVIIVTIIMALLGGMQAISLKAHLITGIFGIFFVMTLCSMTLALGCGHTGITLLIQNSSLIVPTIVGLLIWNEKLTAFKGVGVILILIMLFLSSGDGSAPADPAARANWNKKRWFIFTAMSFIGDSTLNILQKLMALDCESISPTFTFWTSLYSLIAAMVIVVFCRMRGEGGSLIKTRKDKIDFAVCCGAIGLGTAGGNAYLILALTQLPSVVTFPLQQGGVVLLMWLVGVIIYREKVTRRGLAMLVTGLAGIVLLNL